MSVKMYSSFLGFLGHQIRDIYSSLLTQLGTMCGRLTAENGQWKLVGVERGGQESGEINNHVCKRS